jgi:hypothetical protein
MSFGIEVQNYFGLEFIPIVKACCHDQHMLITITDYIIHSSSFYCELKFTRFVKAEGGGKGRGKA